MLISASLMPGATAVIDVDPVKVIFNDAMPLMAAHMVIAAYVVGGFLVASVYAFAMLRGRRDHYLLHAGRGVGASDADAQILAFDLDLGQILFVEEFGDGTDQGLICGLVLGHRFASLGHCSC